MALVGMSSSIGAAVEGGGAPVRPLERATPSFAICTAFHIQSAKLLGCCKEQPEQHTTAKRKELQIADMLTHLNSINSVDDDFWKV
ncbi:MAG: hypothetical protein FRX49_03717 [Trebouxia sp. A1-2]|nr:MAG: hypothetical protein FRX49_03717 [Trebouxia sp. A1-2]